MSETVKFCMDVMLPPEQAQEADRVAARENPVANLAVPTAPGGMQKPGSGAVDVRKKWKPGRTLRIAFMDGDPAVQAKVQAIALEWTEFANIKLEFGDDPDAEIRISFKMAGSWSYIGTDALLIPKNMPTMNYGWLTPSSTDEEYHRVVLHEFGHALGMIHEHQNPDAVNHIKWDIDALKDYYAGPPNNWTEAQIRTNLIATYEEEHTNHTDFDVDSIMRYPVPAEHTLDGNGIPWQAHALSDTDKRFIAAIYPPA